MLLCARYLQRMWYVEVKVLHQSNARQVLHMLVSMSGLNMYNVVKVRSIECGKNCNSQGTERKNTHR